jgi:hypothetical protein
MKRQYIELTGYDFSKRLSMGNVLTDTGEVYNLDINKDTTMGNHVPTLAVDGFDVEVKEVPGDRTYRDYAKTNLAFWQDGDEGKVVVASLSLQAHELRKLKEAIELKLSDLSRD